MIREWHRIDKWICDLKPDNILISQEDRTAVPKVYLIDLESIIEANGYPEVHTAGTYRFPIVLQCYFKLGVALCFKFPFYAQLRVWDSITTWYL